MTGTLGYGHQAVSEPIHGVPDVWRSLDAFTVSAVSAQTCEAYEA